MEIRWRSARLRSTAGSHRRVGPLPPRAAPVARWLLLLGIATSACSSGGSAIQQQHAPGPERAVLPEAAP
jgi:hypothetical protein